VSISGDRLHLILDNPDSEIFHIRSILQTNNINLRSLRPIPFSLEDCFIGIVQRAEGEKAKHTFA
jgi:ABC-2 type transport system ATP-binding protein